MSEIEDRVIDLLTEHEAGSWRCLCGWEWGIDAEMPRAHAAHIVSLLSGAKYLLNETSEWFDALDDARIARAERDEFEAELHDRAILGDGYDRLRASIAEERAELAEGERDTAYLRGMVEGARQVLEAVLDAAPRLNSELRQDGSEDPMMAAYVDAFRDSYYAASDAFAKIGRGEV